MMHLVAYFISGALLGAALIMAMAVGQAVERRDRVVAKTGRWLVAICLVLSEFLRYVAGSL